MIKLAMILNLSKDMMLSARKVHRVLETPAFVDAWPKLSEIQQQQAILAIKRLNASKLIDLAKSSDDGLDRLSRDDLRTLGRSLGMPDINKHRKQSIIDFIRETRALRGHSHAKLS